MVTYFFCPKCHSIQIETIDDYERNIVIFRCERCNEMYSASRADITNLGYQQIFKEWHDGYWNDVKSTHAQNKALEWPSIRTKF